MVGVTKAGTRTLLSPRIPGPGEEEESALSSLPTHGPENAASASRALPLPLRKR